MECVEMWRRQAGMGEAALALLCRVQTAATLGRGAVILRVATTKNNKKKLVLNYLS
jgi:hypothetical protein